MTIATGIIAGLMILGVGGVLTAVIGYFLIGLGAHLASTAKVKPGKAIAAGASGVSGLLVIVAGPLASLWAGISVAAKIIGG